ncbi:MAG TPA: small basic family protein [Oscillospiraceae bacterium]|nr:small basic family protein [Oscillospiraceae bacterium]
MLPLIGLLIGLIIGLFVSVPVPAAWAPYLALLVLSGVDILLSVLNKNNDDKSGNKNFLLEFFTNTVLAVFLAALGKQINFELSTIIAFVFTYRIFKNFREIVEDLYAKYKEKRKSIRREVSEVAAPKNTEEAKRKK